MSTTISSTGSRIGAEFFGMATLTAVVIGSGIMETNLSQDLGIALYLAQLVGATLAVIAVNSLIKAER